MLRKWFVMLLVFALAWAPGCPAAYASQIGADQIDQMLFALARDTEEPWAKAILEAGCDAYDQAAGTVALRSFNPRLKELPSYDKDPDGWLTGFFHNVAQYDLVVPVELDGDALAPASQKALLAAVNKAAATAKSAFDQKQVRVAIAGYLLPAPLPTLKEQSDLDGELNPRFVALVSDAPFDQGQVKWYAPLFYAQQKQSLSVKGGPHNLVLTATGADPWTMAANAHRAALSEMSKLPLDQRSADGRAQQALMKALIAQATGLKKSGGSARELALDIDQLANGEWGEDYLSYVADYRPVSLVDGLMGDIGSLPDEPALDFPATGRISGSKSGTQVNIKAPKDEQGRYVQVRKADTKEMAVDMFIRPGGTCTVRVPKGMYYLTVATGATWYGPEALFGRTGGLSKTEELEIKSSSYVHTITLQVAEGGNMSSYRASAEDFAP